MPLEADGWLPVYECATLHYWVRCSSRLLEHCRGRSNSLSGFAQLPLEVRSGLVWLVALVAARFANWAIYTWCWTQYRLGPWSPAPAADTLAGGVARRVPSKSKSKKRSSAPPRTWADHLPVIGWFLLRRESEAHGKGYWIRPLLIEACFPIAIAGYYVDYVGGGMVPVALQGQAVAQAVSMHWQVLAHCVLFTLMLIASFIDFDEFAIPDLVTVPGTLIGLLGAASVSAWLPFHAEQFGLEELLASLPAGWPLWLNSLWGLLLGCATVLVWGFALLDRRWITRRGLRKAIRYFLAGMFRRRLHWMSVVIVTLLLLLLVCGTWYLSNGGRWPYLLSSLFGLAFAGGVTWAVRISASAGLGVEALGFGDVTLMAMIGTYVGWQPSLLIFFIAPLVAIVFVVLRALITGETATPYGPYLCGATVLVLVYWNAVWNLWAAPLFGLGEWILGIVVACVVLMGALLWIWRLIKQAARRLLTAHSRAGS